MTSLFLGKTVQINNIKSSVVAKHGKTRGVKTTSELCFAVNFLETSIFNFCTRNMIIWNDITNNKYGVKYHIVNFKLNNTEVVSGPCQISEMELSAKIVNCLKSLTTLSCILDVWMAGF